MGLHEKEINSRGQANTAARGENHSCVPEDPSPEAGQRVPRITLSSAGLESINHSLLSGSENPLTRRHYQVPILYAETPPPTPAPFHYS